MESAIKNLTYDFYPKSQKVNGTFLDNVAADKVLMVRDKIYDIYSINLNKTCFNNIKDVLEGCEDVENECWTPQEDFMDYAAKSHFLYYAEREGRISGFFLVSYFIIDQCCIISMDEIMVRKSEQGKKLALKLATTAFRDFDRVESGNKKFRTISLMSITANPKVMGSYSKGSLTNMKFFDSTFNHSEKLKTIHKKYLDQVGYELVHEDHPFFIKNLFPGSNKAFISGEKKYEYDKKLKSLLPEGFDPIHRGDSLCFMLRTNRLLYSLTCFIFMQKIFGLRFWMTKRLGIWPFKKII